MESMIVGWIGRLTTADDDGVARHAEEDNGGRPDLAEVRLAEGGRWRSSQPTRAARATGAQA
jgi:hypothetical protein